MTGRKVSGALAAIAHEFDRHYHLFHILLTSLTSIIMSARSTQGSNRLLLSPRKSPKSNLGNAEEVPTWVEEFKQLFPTNTVLRNIDVQDICAESYNEADTHAIQAVLGTRRLKERAHGSA